MAGLQGSGKTTTAGKLAKWLREQNEEEGAARLLRRLPPGGDRAAGDGRGAGGRRLLPFGHGQKPVDIARARSSTRATHYHDVLIVDTAGRLAIDEAMMQEIARAARRGEARSRRCSWSTRCRARTRSTWRAPSARRCRSPASC
jgi:signal recognition particle subunit SRP54